MTADSKHVASKEISFLKYKINTRNVHIICSHKTLKEQKRKQRQPYLLSVNTHKTPKVTKMETTEPISAQCKHTSDTNKQINK